MPENRDIRVCEAANPPVECSSEKKVLRQQDGEASPRQVLLKVKDLEVTYGSGRKAFKAVNRANFEIYKGETFGLVGESGSGKTTIGRAIMRILPTSGGEVLYKGQKINGKISRQLDQQVIKEIQMIFQDPQSSLNERAKVSYIVGEGLQNVRPDLTAAQREEKVRQALLDVGLLPEFASRFPHEFSGGQRQRIGIARALIVEPEFIIADEPISALDMSIRAQVLNLLRHLQKERGITYLFIAHDLSVMRYIGPHRRHPQGRYRGAGRCGRAGDPCHPPLHPQPALRHPHAQPQAGAEEKAAGLRPRHARLHAGGSPVAGAAP